MRTCVIVAQDGCGAIIRITCEKPRSGASVVHACARKQQAGHGRRRQHGRQRPHHHCPPPLTTSHSSCACAWRAISVFFNTQVHAHAGAHTQPAGASPENLVRVLKTVMAAVDGGASSGGGGMPGGLSAKQQKLFELRMRMVRGPAPRNARTFFRHDTGPAGASREQATGPCHGRTGRSRCGFELRAMSPGARAARSVLFFACWGRGMAARSLSFACCDTGKAWAAQGSRRSRVSDRVPALTCIPADWRPRACVVGEGVFARVTC